MSLDVHSGRRADRPFYGKVALRKLWTAPRLITPEVAAPRCYSTRFRYAVTDEAANGCFLTGEPVVAFGTHKYALTRTMHFDASESLIREVFAS